MVGRQVEHTKELKRRDRHIHANLQLGSCEDVLAFLQALLSALCLNQMVVLRVVHLSEHWRCFAFTFDSSFRQLIKDSHGYGEYDGSSKLGERYVRRV